MQRVAVEPRTNWKQRVEALGFHFHSANNTLDPTYWDERVAYRFHSDTITRIEQATDELHARCMDAVAWVVDNAAYERLHITPAAGEAVARSWRDREHDLYGRFDFLLDAAGTPRMLEYNADTPTSLYEASVIQWTWLEDYQRSGHASARWDQFNSIHERLVESLAAIRERLNRRALNVNSNLCLAALRDELEDNTTVWYLQDCAQQAGWNTQHIAVEDIGWNGVEFTDLHEQRIPALFKLYPWEWIVAEPFGPHFLAGHTPIIEPAWKMVLSNKGLLPLMWELFPDHPNLLEAHTAVDRLRDPLNYVRKPYYSREGANVTIVRHGRADTPTDAGYGAEGFVYQALMPPMVFDGFRPVLGSWVVGGRAAGMGIREDVGDVTTNQSRFVPHYIED